MIKGKHKVNQMVNQSKHMARSQGRVNGKPPLRGLPLPLPYLGKPVFTFTDCRGRKAVNLVNGV